uniref:Lon proteolytic domain-containing protein n=1 Tax=Globodera pallida TaxID=36090 RepID=A0A183CHC3_GLOPA
MGNTTSTSTLEGTIIRQRRSAAQNRPNEDREPIPEDIENFESSTTVENNFMHVRERLDFVGLQELKKTITEMRAVGTMWNICLRGTKEIGIIDVSRKIALALNRRHASFSLRGMKEASEINGSRSRTGKLLDSLRSGGVANPVIVIEDIDKIGADQITSALVNMLDGDKNAECYDHYLGRTIDLSKVLFMCTANNMHEIPWPLRKLVEPIEMEPYLDEEKIQIARVHLIPKCRNEFALTHQQMHIADNAMEELIKFYCREQGIGRAIVLQQAEGLTLQNVINKEELHKYVGPPKFNSDVLYAVVPIGGHMGKSGTSAGIAIVSALLSFALRKSVAQSTAMTGQISLGGIVGGIGGLRAKISAAKRAGLRTVIVPRIRRPNRPNIVQNSLSNKRTLKSARIIAKFGRETKWCHTVPRSPALLIKSIRGKNFKEIGVEVLISAEHLWDFSLSDFVSDRRKESPAIVDIDSSDQQMPASLCSELDRLMGSAPLNRESLLKFAVFWPPFDAAMDIRLTHNGKSTVGLAIASWGGLFIPPQFADDENAVSATLLNALLAVLQFQFSVRPIADGGAVMVSTQMFKETLLQHKRRLVVENLVQTLRTLNALHKLSENIDDLVIPDEAFNDLADGNHFDSESSAEARRLAERANTDPSLLELLNFPSEQKYGVYVPLFLPLLVPLLQPFALFAIFLLLKLKKRRRRTTEDEKAKNE